jgi:hypothetical protein
LVPLVPAAPSPAEIVQPVIVRPPQFTQCTAYELAPAVVADGERMVRYSQSVALVMELPLMVTTGSRVASVDSRVVSAVDDQAQFVPEKPPATLMPFEKL